MPTSRHAPAAVDLRPSFVLPFVALLASACAGATAPDVVIRNARVFTNDAAKPWAEAVAVKGERIVAVGESAAVAATAGSATRVIDAGGRVLVPGFNDARVDLPLKPPTAAALSALDRDAIAHGVTSLQVVAGGPMRALVAAAQQAQRSARWRLIRSPMDGERPQDEEPFLPPQPGDRLVANGVSWVLGRWWDRQALEAARVATVAGWAYGAEDPLIVTVQGDLAEGSGGATGLGALSTLREALRGVGVKEVWQRKRPRLDVHGRMPFDATGFPYVLDAFAAALRDLAGWGVVVTAVPHANANRRFVQDAPDFGEPVWFGQHGVVVAVGSGHDRSLLDAMADFNDPPEDARVHAAFRAEPDTVVHLPRRATVAAATRGGAYAERTERDKGWLGPGTLADLAILSDDVFTVPPEGLRTVTSALTMVGGAIVYDAGILPR